MQRICRTERRWANRTRIAPPGSGKRRRRRIPTGGEDKRPSGRQQPSVVLQLVVLILTRNRDQELRFTVHDSLDYHQLKVSVFNDDKKTDLIGETWVQLDSILVAGGGQNDLWHTLNCKGRYAGEVRIELTYYDTRPREEKAGDAGSIAAPTSRSERTPEAVAGPRQPKQVKRRPLPADPTSTDSSPIRPSLPEHIQSSPLPYTPPRNQQQLHGSSPHSASVVAGQRIQEPTQTQSSHYDMTTHSAPPSQSFHSHPEIYGNSSDAHSSGQLPPSLNEPNSSVHSQQHSHEGGYAAPAQVHSSTSHSDYPREQLDRVSQSQQKNDAYQYQDLGLPELPPHTPRTNRSSTHPSPRYYSPVNSSPSYVLPQYHPPSDVHQQQDARDEMQSYSAPPSVPNDHYRNDRPRDTRVNSHSGPQPVMNDPYQETPLRHHSIDSHGPIRQTQEYDQMADDGPPPPPPPHSHQIPSPHDDLDRHQNYAPAPLQIRPRASISASPLSQSYHETPPAGYARDSSPNESRFQSRPGSMVPSYNPHEQTQKHSSHEPENFPSYTAYEHQAPQRHPENFGTSLQQNAVNDIGHDRRMSHPVGHSYGPSPRYERTSAQEPRYSNPSESYADDGSHQWNGRGYAPREHRASAPLVKPRAVSPDPRTPTRKSVSPQPERTPDSGLPGVPFSPDSYDQLNPNLKSAKSINSLGPKYNTPEGIREAARDREKEKQLEVGPIIDSNGRVIDPSDHLPSDTWAPEPERKTPRKTHEIKLKFRHSPSGAQPMPAPAPRPPREPAIRPQPMTPIATPPQPQHAYSANDISPIPNTGRNRLQKRTRASPGHFNSSPAVPLDAHGQDHSSVSAYPLREHPNYGLGGSPSYAQRGSPVGPPPIPAKVPIGAGQEEWGGVGGTLSDEISRIDIGVGSGGRAGGRSGGKTAFRYGGA